MRNHPKKSGQSIDGYNGVLTERQALKLSLQASLKREEPEQAEEREFDDQILPTSSLSAPSTDQNALINEHRTPLGTQVTCALCRETSLLGVDCDPTDIRGVMIGPCYVQLMKSRASRRFVHINCALFCPEVRISSPSTWLEPDPELRNMLWAIFHTTRSLCTLPNHHDVCLYMQNVGAAIHRQKKKCYVCNKSGAFAGCYVGACPRAFHLKCAFENGAQLFAGSGLYDLYRVHGHRRVVLCSDHVVGDLQVAQGNSRMEGDSGKDIESIVNVDLLNHEQLVLLSKNAHIGTIGYEEYHSNESTGLSLPQQAERHSIETTDGDHIEQWASYLSEGEDDRDYCSVCGNPDTTIGNEIVLCDGCDCAIHRKCAGISHIPEDDWFCASCQTRMQSKRPTHLTDPCEFCPITTKSLIMCKTGTAHAICAQATGAEHLAPNTVCAICHQKTGKLVPCSAPDVNCRTVFHASCAWIAGIDILRNKQSNNSFRFVCAEHSAPRKKRSMSEPELTAVSPDSAHSTIDQTDSSTSVAAAAEHPQVNHLQVCQTTQLSWNQSTHANKIRRKSRRVESDSEGEDVEEVSAHRPPKESVAAKPTVKQENLVASAPAASKNSTSSESSGSHKDSSSIPFRIPKREGQHATATEPEDMEESVPQPKAPTIPKRLSLSSQKKTRAVVENGEVTDDSDQEQPAIPNTQSKKKKKQKQAKDKKRGRVSHPINQLPQAQAEAETAQALPPPSMPEQAVVPTHPVAPLGGLTVQPQDPTAIQGVGVPQMMHQMPMLGMPHPGMPHPGMQFTQFSPTIIVKTSRVQFTCDIVKGYVPTQISWPPVLDATKAAPFNESRARRFEELAKQNKLLLAEVKSAELLTSLNSHRATLETKYMTDERTSFALVLMDTQLGQEIRQFLARLEVNIPPTVEIALLYNLNDQPYLPMLPPTAVPGYQMYSYPPHQPMPYYFPGMPQFGQFMPQVPPPVPGMDPSMHGYPATQQPLEQITPQVSGVQPTLVPVVAESKPSVPPQPLHSLQPPTQQQSSGQQRSRSPESRRRRSRSPSRSRSRSPRSRRQRSHSNARDRRGRRSRSWSAGRSPRRNYSRSRSRSRSRQQQRHQDRDRDRDRDRNRGRSRSRSRSPPPNHSSHSRQMSPPERKNHSNRNGKRRKFQGTAFVNNKKFQTVGKLHEVAQHGQSKASSAAEEHDPLMKWD